MLTESEVLLEQVDHSGHLEVDQTSVSSSFEFGKQLIQLGELPRIENELLKLRNLHRGKWHLSNRGGAEETLRRESGKNLRELLDRCRVLVRSRWDTEDRCFR